MWFLGGSSQKPIYMVELLKKNSLQILGGDLGQKGEW